VGSDRSERVDVRILAATNRDLEGEVEAGRFRQDLYHRLNAYRLRVAPLRERREDIPLLAGHFCDQARLRLGLGPVRLDEAARRHLVAHDWPGNVRELENVVQRGVLRASAQVARGEAVVVSPRHLQDAFRLAPVSEPSPQPTLGDTRPLSERVEDFRREELRRALKRAQGNWAAAARELGMNRGNLHHLAKRLGLR
jgi:anaerobic nitric oxide reductase transcription regulator